jgi:ketosteroid isomerase-like protein
MSEEDVAVVRGYREANDLEAELSYFADDIEWIRPGRTLRGIEALREAWSRPGAESGPENLDVELRIGELEDLGGGRVTTWNHQVFRWKESGELAFERHATIDYVIRDGKIARYEITMTES